VATSFTIYTTMEDTDFPGTQLHHLLNTAVNGQTKEV
jgi:hypothetical protein